MYMSEHNLTNCRRCGDIFIRQKYEVYCENCISKDCFGTFETTRWKRCVGCHAQHNCIAIAMDKDKK